MNLSGRKALVTGASRGVGRAIAIAMTRQGIEVFGTSRNPDACEWPEGVKPLTMELSTPEAAQRSWENAELDKAGISILVNNAGSGVLGGFAETDFADWQAQVELMLLAPMKLCQLAMSGWDDANPGVIVNVSSLACEYPIPYMTGYNIAKSGLSAFSESLLLEGCIKVIELRIGDLNTEFNDSVKWATQSSRIDSVWSSMVKRVNAAPSPKRTADKLIVALQKDRVGVIRSGSFFQTTVASLFGRIVSQSTRRGSNLKYYNID